MCDLCVHMHIEVIIIDDVKLVICDLCVHMHIDIIILDEVCPFKYLFIFWHLLRLAMKSIKKMALRCNLCAPKPIDANWNK